MKRTLMFTIVLAVSCTATYGDDDAAGSPEVKAVRAAVQSYVDAFNKHDAAAVAAHWSEDGEFVTPGGDTFSGRATIQKEFEAYFAETKEVKVEIDEPQIELIAPSVAVERGTARILQPEQEPRATDYEAIHVKHGGSWKMDSVREADKPVERSHYGQLKELDWLVGEWVDADETSSVETTCEWTKNGNFLLRSFKVYIEDRIDIEGTQIIGWDPVRQKIRSWTFDSDGSFGVGVWSRNEDQWTIRAVRVLHSGEQASCINILKYVDENSFTFRSTGREIDGELLPNIDDVTVVRKQ